MSQTDEICQMWRPDPFFPTLYLGVPARHSGWVCKCGVVLTRKVKSEGKEKLICSNCRSRYILDGEKFLILEEKI